MERDETDQAVYPQQDEVDRDDDRLVCIDDGSRHRVVVAEQIRQQLFLVRRVAELVRRYDTTHARTHARLLRNHSIYLLLARLRSSDSLTCVVRRAHNTYGDRCFATAVPRVWNSLPIELQQCDSLGRFKRCLKTFLFRSWNYGAL